METTKTIKGVNEESWAEFKSLAAKDRIDMGKVFERMLEEYKKRSEDAWNAVLKGGRILSEKEAKEMEKITKRTRQELGFRT